jgi:hypothetical protein
LLRHEGNRRFRSALRACGLSLTANDLMRIIALHLALLATFGDILEPLRVKEDLFARRKYELDFAVDALQISVDKIHDASGRLLHFTRDAHSRVPYIHFRVQDASKTKARADMGVFGLLQLSFRTFSTNQNQTVHTNGICSPTATGYM